MILGIGFIMVAAIFPVAISQTKTSQEESVAAAIVRNATGSIGQIVPTQFLPPAGDAQVSLSLLRPTVPIPSTSTSPTINDFYVACLNPTTAAAIGAAFPVSPSTTQTIPGQVWPVGLARMTGLINTSDPVQQLGSTVLTSTTTLENVSWPMVSQNMVQTIDPRYAWVAFYKRDLIETGLPIASGHTLITFAPTLQLIVVAVRATTTSEYGASDVVMGATPTTLQPTHGQIQFTPKDVNHFSTTLAFSDATSKARAVEGAFIIIANDSLPTNNPAHGALNGHFYRLGNVDSATGSWQLAPGYELSSSDLFNMAGGEQFDIYIIGRSQDPNASNQFAGNAQDIAVYSTFLYCGTN